MTDGSRPTPWTKGGNVAFYAFAALDFLLFGVFAMRGDWLWAGLFLAVDVAMGVGLWRSLHRPMQPRADEPREQP